MALAVVMIYQAIDHLNFAQGEMAMFSTFIAWQLIHGACRTGSPSSLAVGVSFVGGVLIERVLFRPLHNAPILSNLVAFIALFSILNSARRLHLGLHDQDLPDPVRHTRRCLAAR